MKNGTKKFSIIFLITFLTVATAFFYLNLKKVNGNIEIKENSNNGETIQNDNNDGDIEEDVILLTKEEAKQKLLSHNNIIDYEYQGDENTYKESLYDKGYEGYVFLPTVESDLGYFVDKLTGILYYFNPNGYLEEIK